MLIARPRPRILIVDDNHEIIKVLTTLLAKLADISFATTGTRALDIAMELMPDLVLLDMELPDISGLVVCARLKSNPDFATIPVLFITAGDTADAELSALEAGAVDFIAKPLRPQVVLSRVTTQLALRQKTLQLELLVNLDGLTGVNNRRYFDNMLEQEVARHRRSNAFLVVALVDVDHFKLYNDTFGHQKGDECLRTVAQTLRLAMRRPADVLARYGGEEFGVIAPVVALEGAQNLGAWIGARISALALPHPASTTSSIVTVSSGISCGIPSTGTSTRDFLTAADKALYEAKASGRNGYVVHEI